MYYILEKSQKSSLLFCERTQKEIIKYSYINILPISGIFSAGLSTISAGLNSLALVTLEDYIKPIYTKCSGQQLSESKSIVFGKALVIIFGMACIALAFAAQLLGGILQVYVHESMNFSSCY